MPPLLREEGFNQAAERRTRSRSEPAWQVIDDSLDGVFERYANDIFYVVLKKGGNGR